MSTIRLRAHFGRQFGGIDDILDAERDARQRTGVSCLGAGIPNDHFRVDMRPRLDQSVTFRDPVEAAPRDIFGGKAAGTDASHDIHNV